MQDKTVSMGELTAPNTVDVLRSLRLLRSDVPVERTRGISILSTLLDDPRVLQVFEYLYQHDPDPGVRELAWRAINRQGPSVPMPGPGRGTLPPASESAAPAAPAPPEAPARSGSKPKLALASGDDHASRTLFLLNPANAPFVVREMQRRARRRKGGRTAFALVSLLLLVLGLLMGLILPDWVAWYRLQQSGITVPGEISELSTRNDHFYARYSFTPQGTGSEAETRSAEQRVSEDTFNRLAVGAAVNVTYLPDAPDTSWLNHYNPDNRARDVLSGVALGVMGVILGLLILGSIQRRRPAGPPVGRQLLRGRVVACTGMLDADGDFNVKLRYQFQTPAGRTRVEQLSRIRNDLKKARLPDRGTPVAVYYVNEKTHRLL
jgi:hypothetical protein